MTKNLVVFLCVAGLTACNACFESASVITRNDWDKTTCGMNAHLEVVNSGPDTAVVQCVCADKVEPTVGTNPRNWGQVGGQVGAIAAVVSAAGLVLYMLGRAPGRRGPSAG